MERQQQKVNQLTSPARAIRQRLSRSFRKPSSSNEDGQLAFEVNVFDDETIVATTSWNKYFQRINKTKKEDRSFFLDDRRCCCCCCWLVDICLRLSATSTWMSVMTRLEKQLNERLFIFSSSTSFLVWSTTVSLLSIRFRGCTPDRKEESVHTHNNRSAYKSRRSL